MTAITTANSRSGERAPNVPLKENGDHYEFILYHDGDRYISYSDDVKDLYDILLPGYSEKSDEEQLDERFKLALRLQKSTQAQIYASLTPEDLTSLEDWEVEVIQGTYENEEQPFMVNGFWKERLPEGTNAEDVPLGDRVDVWTSTHPIVLIEPAYSPWTQTPMPLGKQDGSNTIILKPLEEVEFLDSLTETGWVTFGEKKN